MKTVPPVALEAAWKLHLKNSMLPMEPGEWTNRHSIKFLPPQKKWTSFWNEMCNRWHLSNPMTPLRGALVILPISLCPEEVMNIYNASGKWWSQTHCINPHQISCTQIPYWPGWVLGWEDSWGDPSHAPGWHQEGLGVMLGWHQVGILVLHQGDARRVSGWHQECPRVTPRGSQGDTGMTLGVGPQGDSRGAPGCICAHCNRSSISAETTVNKLLSLKPY